MHDSSKPPNRAERKQCWDSRDAFFKCLEENNEDASKCKQFRKIYEDLCPKTWVTHFDRRRRFLQYKEKIETEGYEPITESDNKT